ncbi:hypothetical protein [Streptomyces spectabilis]|uniref:Uncharacterized protein n=1 Tax=Streptomyces spectabilis TaxID=68270 RepID=A0A5P2WZB4_STRST|nr:hypothetical protein [Streptomyces spectabilis]MBB5108843.1 hypothetical protein [Streptomyces spectabilis]MCI3899854.1 hypothetical protein [Streptomyces spectabilis]QEV57511.1 hypothetical protein CP982_01190 [Streptomyces spectabilis]
MFAVIGVIGVLVSSAVAIWGLPAALESSEAAKQAETRERNKEKQDNAKEERLTIGPAIDIAAGEPNLEFSRRYALAQRTTNEESLPDDGFLSNKYWAWFAKNKGLRVNEATVRVTIFPIHRGTVVIQNMRITNLSCKPTRYTGTAVVPPSFGDSGGEALPTAVAFDLTEPSPRPWKHEGWVPTEDAYKLSGNAFAKAIYLDGGEDFDARAFDLSFFTRNKDCKFGVEVNVTTAGRGDEWYRVVFPGRRLTYEVAGRPERYDTSVVSEGVEEPPVLRGPYTLPRPPTLQKGLFLPARGRAE